MAVETVERPAEAPAAPVHEDTSRVKKYRVRTGMFAWMAHRLSGLGILFYLVIHVWGLKALSDRDAFNDLIAGYHTPIFKVGEFLLLAAVLYHAFNGLRIVLIDFLGWSPEHKRLFWVLGAVFIILLVVGGYPSLAALFR